MAELTGSWDALKEILIGIGSAVVPLALFLIYVNYRVRRWERKQEIIRQEELLERQSVKELAKEEAAEVKKLAEENAKEIKLTSEQHAAKIKQDAQENAARRSQENMCIIRAIRDTGNLSRIITVATKAQANGEKIILNGDVDKALNQYDTTMKELDEFIMMQNARHR